MTREEFIEILKFENIDYYIDDKNNLIITNKNENINLNNITYIPDNVKFYNNGDIFLISIKKIGNNVEFNNSGLFLHLENIKNISGNVNCGENISIIILKSLEKVTGKIQFNNKGEVYLNNLKYLTKNIIFNNKLSLKNNINNIYFSTLEKIENGYIFNNNIKNIYINKIKKFPLKVKFYNIGKIGYHDSNFMNNIKKYCPQGISYKRFFGGYNK